MGQVLIPVYETFHAWQGEGVHAGRAAFFIRTFGCPVHCHWCDAAGTWHPDWVPAAVERATPESLAERAAAHRCAFVVVTGGEPSIHDLRGLVDALHSRGLRVHLETSGAFALRGDFDWVTLSPKRARPPLDSAWNRADELKLIVEHPDDLPFWWSIAQSRSRAAHVWLHPEWSRRGDQDVLTAINTWVKQRGDPFRAGWQLHKLYGVDETDARSRPPVPLGGDPARGW